MKTNVLVTGASGQLGQTLKALSHNHSEYLQFSFFNKEELDILDVENVAKTIESNAFDYCVNLAAYTNVEKAESDKENAFKINYEAVANLARLCKATNTTLIHISTDYVFDGNKTEPYTVLDSPNPINVYGNSKLKGEEAIQQIMDRFFIIRTSWLYSKNYGNNFYKTILRKARNGESINVVDNQKSCPTDCELLANSILNIIKKRSQKWGIYHCSGKSIMTWYEFAIAILRENNLLDSTLVSIDNNYVTFAKRPKYSVLENSDI